MYQVYVIDKGKVIASGLEQGLADAVALGRRLSSEGNRIVVYDALQDSSGEVLHLSKVLSVVVSKEVDNSPIRDTNTKVLP
jgi:hypothetical protein